MLSNLDGLLDEAVTGCHGFKNENHDGTDDATHCNQVRKISCHGCRGCHGGFDSARDAKTLIQALNAAGPAGAPLSDYSSAQITWSGSAEMIAGGPYEIPLTRVIATPSLR